MEAALNELLHWIQAHPNWAGLFVLLVAALESFLVIGLFMPGTVIMFGIGAMIAAGTMELVPTLIWSTIGAIIGDGSSYLIGRYYHQRLRVMWPFRKYPHMISRGVDFFHQHGGKSIVMARFVGPVRPLLPAVAGMLDMPAKRFFMFNTLSAVLWAPAYIFPGVLFGASLGVAAEIAGRLALLLIILVALLWFSWWLVQRIARSLQPHAHAVQLGILDWSRRHERLQPLTAALLDPQHPEARGMTVLTALLVIASWALLTLIGSPTTGGPLYDVDLYLFHQLQALRSPLGDKLMVAITGLGSGLVLYGFALLLGAWLLWQRRWRVTLHWAITVACVGLLTQALKNHMAVARPPLVDTTAMSYAFPSAHASVSVAVFGFLAVAVARELRSNWHWLPYSMAMFLIIAISFSRLYLGVHWLSDILGGLSLGLLWVALMGIAYRQHPAPPIAARVFTPVALVALLSISSLYTARHFNENLAFYQPQPAAKENISRADWLSAGWENLPAFRDAFESKRNFPLNVQWLAPRATLERQLRDQGWQTPHTTDMAGLLDLFSSDAGLFELPVLPQVHRGNTQQILLARTLDDHLLILRLWDSGLRESGTEAPLWIGSATYLYIEERFGLLRFLRTDPDFDSALQQFADILHDDYAVRRRQREVSLPPVSTTIWSGELLLIGDD
jgi:undecaprenyl-diphosphatase